MKSLNKPEFVGGQIAGLRKPGESQPMSLGKGFGDWEKHTRGMGAKILLKMGFEAGKGLGKELQGRSTVVEAHLRKGRGAIGAYGKEGNRPKAEQQPIGKKHALKKYDQFALNTSCFWGSTGSNIAPVVQFHEIFVIKIMNKLLKQKFREIRI